MTDYLSRARALRASIESQSEAIEAANTLTAPVVDAIAEAGLFRLVAPSVYGGAEADIDTIFDVFEELAFADSATSWAVAQNTTVHAYAAYLAPEYARELVAARASAGMFAPLGTMVPEGDGYTVQGSYQFGSGSGHADFMGGAAMVMKGGEMVFGADGMPEIRGFIVPADKVTLKGNWDVMGLRGTGSFDFDVPEQHVAAGQTFEIFNHSTVAGGPLYGIGPVSVGTVSSCGWAIGTARRALYEVAEIARGGRARLGSAPLAEQPVFQQGYGEHLSALDAASLLGRHAYRAAVQGVSDGVDKPHMDALLRDTRAAASHVAATAKAVTTFAWESSGSAGMRNPGKLQRCFRDICTGAGHQVFDKRNFQELAKPALGQEPSGF